MKFKFLILFLGLWLAGNSQLQTVLSLDTTAESRKFREKWLKGLFEMGVEKKNDSVYIRQEVIRLVKDSAYRSSVYPAKYSWSTVIPLLKRMELKKAFWHLINIYMADTSTKQMVVGTFMLYDSLIDMENMLINTYYTYAFTDPRVCRIKNNKPEIYRPDLLEKSLNATRELINYVSYFREEKNKSKIKKTN